MSQRVLNVRARSCRVAVLINRDATPSELITAFKFLSYLWGGRHCELHAVARIPAQDQIAMFRLTESRPDFVYGIGIEHEQWKKAIDHVCQPRGYSELTEGQVDGINHMIEGHVTAGHVVYHLQRTPLGPGEQLRQLRLVTSGLNSNIYPFVAALFGIHYPNIRSALPCEGTLLDTNSVPADYINLHTDLITKNEQTWLDLASTGLDPYVKVFNIAGPPPTVVLADSLATDLSLFWSIRLPCASHSQFWIMPIPLNNGFDHTTITCLKNWLMAFPIYQQRPNFCRVTSASVTNNILEDFAVRLRTELSGTPFEHVDVWTPPIRRSLVIPRAFDQHVTADLDGRLLSFEPPRPRLLEEGLRGSWMVEIVEDVRTGRAIRDLCLPSRPSTLSVLNAPGPTSISLQRVLPFGDGVDGINIYCSDRRERVHLTLPSPDEILEEVLRETDIIPIQDEKRASYRPVIRKFGGLNQAAAAFSGKRAHILRELATQPLCRGELFARAKLGNGKLSELADPAFQGNFLTNLDPVARRIFGNRRRKRWTSQSPNSPDVDALLDFWATKGIVTRQWQLGPCSACRNRFWESKLDIRRPVRCPGCGNQLSLQTQVPLGFSVHRLIGHAIQQGIMPVVLAGRVLKHLTNCGFFWMPGVKYRWDGKDGDLDLLACCDGHIVVGECKTMSDATTDQGVWEKVFEQFSQTINVGKACRASFVVLAVLADQFPEGYQERLDKLAEPDMRCLLLNRGDLEGGRPRRGADQRFLSLRDLLVDPIPKTLQPLITGPRHIITPFYTAIYNQGPSDSKDMSDSVSD